MTIDQALATIKQVLDAGAAHGLFQNMETATTAANAYNTIFEHCKPAPQPQPAENAGGD